MLLRRRVVILPHTILPRYYQQVEWIYNDGVAYINTNLTVATTLKLAIELSDVTTGSSYEANSAPIFGTNSTWAFSGTYYNYAAEGKPFRFHSWGENKYYDCDVGDIVAGRHYNLFYDNTVPMIYLNGAAGEYVSKDQSWPSPSGSKVWLWYGGMGNGHSKYKLYMCKIYNGNTIVRNFYPCYRRSDKAIGLYDLQNKVFYTNATTGGFTKGGNVNKEL